MYILTADEIKEVEARENSAGMGFLRMMENAGAASARVARIRLEELYSEKTPEKMRVCVVCGKGKNAGDGFVIARKLCEYGASVSVIMLYDVPAAEDARIMYQKMLPMPIKILNWRTAENQAEKYLADADMIVDSIFGIGFRGAADEYLGEVFGKISNSPAYVLSIDLPSGLSADSGKIAGECVHADETIAITCLKPVHAFKPAAEPCGRVTTVQIGIPEETVLSVSPSKMTVSHADISAVLPKRSTVSHKGDFGRVLCICGSRNMPGAAVLAVTGAVRAGAGLVTAAFPGGAYNAIAPHLTEPLLLPLGGEAESFALKDFAALKPAIKNADCILIGCGIGQSPETRELVYAVIRGAQCPVVIDADGINAVARNINILKEAKAGVILTPHPGEMSRLTGLSAEAILNDTCAAAEKFAKETGAVIALKTANTAVANGSGCVYVNRGGNDGMAKGGSGDLLAGMTASLAAQGMKLFDAATAAVYIHSEAGDRAAKKLSRRGMTPSDMARELPMLLSEFE